jgi:hypothetical protein
MGRAQPIHRLVDPFAMADPMPECGTAKAPVSLE